jgi:PilZ domain
MEQDRRRFTRYPLIAHMELLEESTHTRLKSRVSDISMEGCYLDMVNPLPSGTLVRLTITAGDARFEARGRIVYTLQHMGAGVRFEEISPESVPVLKSWLAEAAGTEQRTTG